MLACSRQIRCVRSGQGTAWSDAAVLWKGMWFCPSPGGHVHSRDFQQWALAWLELLPTLHRTQPILLCVLAQQGVTGVGASGSTFGEG